MRRTFFAFIFLFICFTIYSQEKRLALVIGNGNYQYGGILANPENDAKAIYNILRTAGFDVIKYENLEQNSMRQAIDNFGDRLKNYDVGLFFYAGHGIQAKGRNYLIPIDANLKSENDVEYTCVEAGRVLGKMEDARSKTNIVILDACRDNPFERSWTRSSTGRGLAFMNAPTGSLIAYATSPGNTASDGTGENGLYTSALLTYMVEPNITVLQMFQKVRTLVRKSSNNRQTPWESTSLEGDFYFVLSEVVQDKQEIIEKTSDILDEYTVSYEARTGTFPDSRDEKTYKWVKIGDQIWMAENLNYVTAYGSWCYDDKESNCNTYGRLYNWETAKKVCPDSWHVPSDAEWTELIDFLGGTSVAGGKMKETGTTHWDSPNTGATNESGFIALPGGNRRSNGAFHLIGSYGRWWSSTEGYAASACHRYLDDNNAYIGRSFSNQNFGFSVRCIRNK